MHIRNRLLSIFAMAAAGIIVPLVPSISNHALAQTKDLDPPSPERGLAFAQRFCRNCHLVEGAEGGSAQAGIPSLRGIANRPGQTGEHIRNILINPHPPMPDMQVSNQEILDVIAYLETLRTDKAAPPLLAPHQQGVKPIYPKPS